MNCRIGVLEKFFSFVDDPETSIPIYSSIAARDKQFRSLQKSGEFRMQKAVGHFSKDAKLSASVNRNIFEQERNMAVGWTRDGGVQDQIDASVKDAVKLARSRLPDGESSIHCEDCEAVIPEARRKAIPGVRLCVSCQSEREKQQAAPTVFNRRGSKDSQLK